MEAKKLDESLASHRMQMLNYANAAGIPHAGLTDGNHWEMYTVFDQAPIEQRRILDVSIANTPAHESALKLLLLWRPNLASARPVAASAPVVVDVPIRQEPVIPKPEQAAQADLGSWISLAKVETGKGQKHPKAVRFSGGEIRPIKTVPQVVTEIAKELSKVGLLKAADCPIGELPFLNSNPTHPNGTAFSKPVEISGGLYVNAYMNYTNTIRYSLKLLTNFSVDPATIELRFE